MNANSAAGSTRLAWATDIHLDAAQAQAYESFVAQMRQSQADLVLITGDIAEGPSLISTLDQLATDLDRPIAYVMGNHDYYGRAIAVMRHEAARYQGATYLTAQEPLIALGAEAALIGHDGWAGGGLSAFTDSFTRLQGDR